MLFVNEYQIFTLVTTQKTEENFSSSTALLKNPGWTITGCFKSGLVKTGHPKLFTSMQGFTWLVTWSALM